MGLYALFSMVQAMMFLPFWGVPFIIHSVMHSRYLGHYAVGPWVHYTRPIDFHFFFFLNAFY